MRQPSERVEEEDEVREREEEGICLYNMRGLLVSERSFTKSRICSTKQASR